MKIPWRMKWLLWWTTLKKNKQHEKLVKIGQGGSGANSILFLLPAEKETAQIVAHLVKRDMENENRQIRYVIHQNGLPFYPENLKPYIITYSDDDLNWWGTLKSFSVLDRIKTTNYDALVDMNQTINPTLMFLAANLDIPIKIGFQSSFAEEFYTMVIQPSSSGFFENNYETIERVLGLS
jgi:hypothetical protein